jgi:hypothetical protein
MPFLFLFVLELGEAGFEFEQFGAEVGDALGAFGRFVVRAKEEREVVSWPCRAGLGPGLAVREARSERIDLDCRRAEL